MAFLRRYTLDLSLLALVVNVIADAFVDRRTAGAVVVDLGHGGLDDVPWMSFTFVAVVGVVAVLVQQKHVRRFASTMLLVLALLGSLVLWRGYGDRALCEHGIVTGSGVTRWEDVRTWIWQEPDLLRLELRKPGYPSYEIVRVPEDRVGEVKQELAKRIALR